MKLFGATNIPFVSNRRIFFIISAVLVLASILVVIFKGFRYGVDFTGGGLVQVRFSQPVKIDAVRTALAAMGETGASIQQTETGDFLIRVKPKEKGGGESGFSTRLRQQFATSFPGNSFEVLRDEAVGPRISKELKGKVLLAILIGMIGILIYVSFRFDFRFGTGAVLALIHDALIVLGFCSLFNKEITTTLIAAILTVIGYSVNDSIVVSDRIREDTKKIRRESFAEIANRAINQTLNRTVVTSLTTLFVSIALLILASAEIRDFAFAMTVGIIFGTYSSIFVVANLVVELEQRFPTRRRR
ncbi:MAG: protein translocase subunit SecF [candidate division WOR-3 bacterium]|jgi:preprotein translocase subunit SecF